MVTVTGGDGRRRITRSCLDRMEAEQWAQDLIKAGITPVKIDGMPFVLDEPKQGDDRPGIT